MSNTIIIGDLEIAFTTAFDKTWEDRGSRANKDVSTWRPKPMPNQQGQGYYPIGDIAMPNYSDPNKKEVGVLVRDRPGASRPALAVPAGKDTVWRYVKETLTSMGTVSSRKVYEFHNLTAPADFIAMGGLGGTPADPSLYRCVRKDLTVSADAQASKVVWTDAGTSGGHKPGSIWSITPYHAPEGTYVLAPNVMVGAKSRSQPPETHAFKAAPFEKVDPPAPPTTPPFTSTNQPAARGDVVLYKLKMPWFSVKDPGLKPIEQLTQSPVYELVRSDCYVQKLFLNNTTSIEQEKEIGWSYGFNKTETQSFTKTFGFELGGEFQLSQKLSISGKFSGSYAHGVETSTTTQWSVDMRQKLKVPPRAAGAAYVLESAYELYRSNGGRIQAQKPMYSPGVSETVEFPRTRRLVASKPIAGGPTKATAKSRGKTAAKPKGKTAPKPRAKAVAKPKAKPAAKPKAKAGAKRKAKA
ncbi:MAG TPA: Vps62-related protein [Chthoniobacteraceae bacterium]|jgi:hypothetical protein|nr:Vps62-related protein [Chthoniobacteraceae bacterium]